MSCRTTLNRPLFWLAPALGLAFVVLVLWLLAGPTPPAHAAPTTYYVKPSGNDALSCTFANPCRSVQRGVNVASNGDTIYIAGGDYSWSAVPTHGSNGLVDINNSVSILAGWDDSFTIRDPQMYTSTLDAQQNDRVIYITGDVTPTIDGFLVTGGRETYGGGIYVQDAHPIIANSVISGNQATLSGGGLHFNNAHRSTVLSSTIRNNSVLDHAGDGGGVFVQASSELLFQNTYIVDNQAGDGGGGIIWTSNCHAATLRVVSIINNTADRYGGFAIVDNGTTCSTGATLQDVIVKDNRATNGDYGGFRLVLTPGTSSILDHVSIISNTASNNHGGAGIFGSNAILSCITVMSNTANSVEYGGLYVQGSNISLSNATVRGNRITNGDQAGLSIFGPYASLTNVTITDNYAGDDYGGLYLSGGYATLSDVTATNNIANGGSSDTADGVAGIYLNSSPVTLTNVSAIGNLGRGTGKYANAGGIYISGNNATLNHVSAISNSTNYDCGGLFLGGSANISHLTLISNTAEDNCGGGYVHGIPLTISYFTLRNNRAPTTTTSYGGGLNVGGSCKLQNGYVAGNQARYGGGLHFGDGGDTCTLQDSYVAGNQAQYGGGIHIGAVSLISVANTFVANNYAGADGGGLHAKRNTALINNTFVGNNLGPAGQAILFEGDLNSFMLVMTNTIIASHTVGIERRTNGSVYNDHALFWHNITSTTGSNVYNTNGISCDPALVNPGASDYRLTGSSCAIDAGTNAGAPDHDYDGDTRPYDGDGNGTSIVDIGADEYTPTPDFLITASPPSHSVVEGSQTAYTVYLTGTNGFSSAVTLSLGGLPVGATVAWAANPAVPTTTVPFTVTTAYGTLAGSYPLTVTGTSGSLVHTAPATLSVTDYSGPSPLANSTKTAYPTMVAPGSLVTYTITLLSSGPGAVLNARLTDTLPVSVTYQPGSLAYSSGSGGYAGGVVTWTGDVPVSPPALVTFSVRVSDTLGEGDVVKNSAVIDDGVTGPIAPETPITITTAYFLLAASPAGREVVAGQYVTYTACLTGVGGFASPVALSLGGLPVGATVAWAANPAVPTTTVPFTVTTAYGTLAGSYPLTITGTSGSLARAATATLSVTDYSGPSPLANAAKTAFPKQVAPGGQVNYNITLSSAGPGPVLRARLTDTLPVSTTYKDGSLTYSSGSGGYAGGVITWTGDVPVSPPVQIAFSVRVGDTVPKGAVLNNSVVVDDGATQPITPTVPVTITLLPQVIQLKATPNIVYEGQGFQLTWATSNAVTTTLFITPTLPGGGSVAPNGTLNFTTPPTGTYYFVMTATNESGHDEAREMAVVLPNTTPITPRATRRWLAALYFNGDNDLWQGIQKGFNYAEKGACDSDKHVVVLWDSKDTGSWLFELQCDTDMSSPATPDTATNYVEGTNKWRLWPGVSELSMSDPLTLIAFLQLARATWPAHYTFVSIAGHGSGWLPDLLPGQPASHGSPGLSYDYSDPDNYISTWELGKVFEKVSVEGSSPVNVLFYDACLMQTMENAYEIKGYVQYLVGSENVFWAKLPYDDYLGAINSTITPAQLAGQVVQLGYNSLVTKETPPYPVTLSAIDLGKIDTAAARLDDLSLALSGVLPAQKNTIRNSFIVAQRFDGPASDYKIDSTEPYSSDVYVDEWDFADKTGGIGGINPLAAALKTAIQDAVIAEMHESTTSPYNMNLDGAKGVSIYAPLGQDHCLRGLYTAQHSKLARDTHWDEFLAAYWDWTPPPPFTLECVNTPRPPVEKGGAFLPIIFKNYRWLLRD